MLKRFGGDDDDGFAAACRRADEKQRRKPRDPHLDRLRAPMDDNISLERAWHELNTARLRGRAAQSTIEALMLGLRRRGTAALTEAPVRRRLSQLSEQQLHEVCGRLQRLKPEIARAWTGGELDRLLETWDAFHGR